MVACLDHFLHTTDHFTTLPVSFATPVLPRPGNIISILTFLPLGQMSLLRWLIWYHPQLRLCITLPKQTNQLFKISAENSEGFVGILCILHHMFETCQTAGERHSCQRLVGNSEFYKHCGRFLCCLCFTVRNV